MNSCSSVAIVWFDQRDRPVAANRQAARLHGFPSVDAMLQHGWRAIDFVAQQDRTAAQELFEQLRSQSSSHHAGVHLRRMEGADVLADLHATMMFDDQGVANGFVVVAHDIEARERDDDESVRQKKLASLGLLAGGIAHEFNNFLTGILGNIELARLEANGLTPVLLRLDEAEAAIRRAAMLTEQLDVSGGSCEPVSRRSVGRLYEAPAPDTGASHRILVMDDDPIVLEVFATMLEQLGYRATCTTNGQDAITAYRRAMIDSDEYTGVLVDLTILDGMGGAELVKRLRQIDAHVCAVVSSGDPYDPIVRQPREHGFAEAIVKPFSIGELRQALEKVTSSG